MQILRGCCQKNNLIKKWKAEMRKLEYVKLSMHPWDLSRWIFGAKAQKCYKRLNHVICIKMQAELSKQHHISKLSAHRDKIADNVSSRTALIRNSESTDCYLLTASFLPVFHPSFVSFAVFWLTERTGKRKQFFYLLIYLLSRMEFRHRIRAIATGYPVPQNG